MAKLEEIIKTEMSRSDSRTFSRIHLFREGSFLRAYEQSAWLMSRYAAAELNPKRHKTKQTADGTFVFVGFPLTSHMEEIRISFLVFVKAFVTHT